MSAATSSSAWSKAQEAGFAVDPQVIDRGVDYLKQQFQPVEDLEGYQLNQQAFILYVLASAGQGDMGRSVALYDVRERLAHYGQAWLALTFGMLGEQGETTAQERVSVLLDDLTGAAIVSATGAHWEEKSTDWWTMNTNVRSTTLALDALAKLDPENALAPNVVRWLMSVRQDGTWETTQENAWAIMALTDWMVATGELDGDYSYDVTLNGSELDSGTVNRDNVAEPIDLRVEVSDLLLDAANGVTISRFATGDQTGDGQLYYSMYLNYYLPAAELPPLDRGIILDRQYLLIDPVTGEPKPGNAMQDAQIGDTVQVTLTLIAPHDLHYLVLESPLPAGAEAIDPSLLTTSQVYEDAQLTWDRSIGLVAGGAGRRRRPSCGTRRSFFSPPSCRPAPTNTPTRCAPACPASSRCCRRRRMRCTSRRCGGGVRGSCLRFRRSRQ